MMNHQAVTCSYLPAREKWVYLWVKGYFYLKKKLYILLKFLKIYIKHVLMYYII